MASTAADIALWHTGRATGIFSILLLTFVIILGVLVNRKGELPGQPRSVLTELHRNVSLLALAFVLVHVLTAVLDPTVSISGAAVVVPFASAYEPAWIGLGAIAFDLFAAVLITSLIRQRIGHRTWLAVHWLTYAAWPVALAHGLGTATDLHSAWELVLTWACVAAVALALGWRVVTTRLALPPGKRAAAMLSDSGRGLPGAAAAPRVPPPSPPGDSRAVPVPPAGPASGDEHR
jgi:methionine sulfoxide reductase heme-binding subunit